MGNQPERLDFDVGWLVGVWESEGWISLRACYLSGNKLQSYRPEIGITNTDPIFLDEVQRALREMNLAHWRTRWQKFKNKRSRAIIRIDGIKRCQRFIDTIGIHFRSKHKRIEIVRKFIEYRLSVPYRSSYGPMETKWFLELKNLNAPISRQS